MEQFERATKTAEALARRLGPGWEPVVWENLGWHAKAVKGGLKVQPFAMKNYKSYSAFLGEPGHAGGRWAERGKTPAAAVRNVIAKARGEIMRATKDLDEWLP